MEYTKKVIRRFKDYKESYKNPKTKKENPIIYVVYINDFGNFEIGLTVINPGTVNHEFYMTKGHKHKKSGKELYVMLGGKGKLIIQDKKTKIIKLKQGKLYIIPGKSGHKLINTGKKKLEVLTIYNKDSGHDYNFKFKKRFFE